MYQNQTSIRMKKQNTLKAKVQIFQSTFRQSQKRMKSTSSIQNLAGKLYSTSSNKVFTKYATKSKSKNEPAPSSERPTSLQRNPQRQKHIALKGLQMRASHVVSYAEINTGLLKQKERLELYIKNLKQNIAKQKKKLANTEYQLKKTTNQKQHAMDQYNDAHARSQRLQQQINQTQQNLNLYQKEKNQLKNQLQITQNNKNTNINRCKEVSGSVYRLKHELMNEEKARTLIKAELAKELKVMSSNSIYTKQLEDERANVLLEINKFVQSSKI